MSKRIKPNPPPPPIADRPKCPACGKRLKPFITYDLEIEEYDTPPFGRGHHTVQTNHRWRGDYQGYGHFCTLRCGVRWANAVYDFTGGRYRLYDEEKS